MNFKENEIVSDNLTKIKDHFYKIANKELTTEKMLGFTREYNGFIFNSSHALSLKESLNTLMVNHEILKDFDFKNSLSEEKHIVMQKVKRTYSHSSTSGLIDEYMVQGHLAIYKEWIEFANRYGYKSENSENLILKELLTYVNEIKESEKIINNLSGYVDLLINNSRNTRYLNNLSKEFKNDFEKYIISYNDFLDSINRNVNNYKDKLEKLEEEIDNIKEYLQKYDKNILISMAEKFCLYKNNNTNSPSDFLKIKELEEYIDVRIILKGQPMPDNILFKDGSYGYVEKGEYKHTIKSDTFRNLKNDLFKSSIGYLLRKKPKISEYFKTFVEDEPVNLIISVLDTYQKYSDVILKDNLDILKIKDKSLEVIDDTFNHIILNHKINQYTKSILSKKYEHLMSDESDKIFKSLYEMGINKNTLQDYIGKKLASIKNSNDFFDYITKVKNHFSGFNEEILSMKLKSSEITPCYDKDGIVIFNVDTFEESKKLGSVSWCICRNENYFDQYKGDDNKQYFMYDFNKKEEDEYSMIGFTVNKNGSLYVSHLKNDDSFDFEVEYKDLYLEVLKNNMNNLDLNDVYKKLIEDKYNIKIDKSKKIGINI